MRINKLCVASTLFGFVTGAAVGFCAMHVIANFTVKGVAEESYLTAIEIANRANNSEALGVEDKIAILTSVESMLSKWNKNSLVDKTTSDFDLMVLNASLYRLLIDKGRNKEAELAKQRALGFGKTTNFQKILDASEKLKLLQKDRNSNE